MGHILWLASYPKAGNTWVRTFMVNLAANRPEPVPFAEHPKFCTEEAHINWYRGLVDENVNDPAMRRVAAVRAKAQKRIADSFQQPVLVKTHSANHKIHGHPQINKAVTGGAIYIVRNPLDLTISYAHHMGQTIDQAIENMANFKNLGLDRNDPPGQVPEILSDWSSHVKSWTAAENPRLHVIRYEDLIDSPRDTFAKLARFLGFDIDKDPERLDRAIAFSSFDTLRQAEEAGAFSEQSPHNKQFFREGRKDQWRDKLSRKQIKTIRERHGEQMRRFGYV